MKFFSSSYGLSKAATTAIQKLKILKFADPFQLYQTSSKTNEAQLRFLFCVFTIYHSNTNVLDIFWLQIAALMFIRNMFIKWKNCALVPILLPRHPLLPMFRLSPRKVTRKAWCLVLPESSRKENYPVGNRRLRQQPHRRPRWPPTTGLKVSFWCIHTRTYVGTCTYTSYSLLLI